MVKSVLGQTHSGLRDWLIQRVSAMVMVIYTIGIFIYLAVTPQVNYENWHVLFSYSAVKIATLVFLLSILWHAWVGLWTIFTDYVKCFVLRLILHVLVLFALIAFFFKGLLILWGVN
jgi:succinate dehydrogenase / fumarate reductase, membrane anchor subunit